MPYNRHEPACLTRLTQLLRQWFHTSGRSVCILMTDDDGTVAAEGNRRNTRKVETQSSSRVLLLKLPGFFDCLRILCNMAQRKIKAAPIALMQSRGSTSKAMSLAEGDSRSKIFRVCPPASGALGFKHRLPGRDYFQFSDGSKSQQWQSAARICHTL